MHAPQHQISNIFPHCNRQTAFAAAEVLMVHLYF